MRRWGKDAGVAKPLEASEKLLNVWLVADEDGRLGIGNGKLMPMPEFEQMSPANSLQELVT